MSLLDFSPRIPLGTFSILLNPPPGPHGGGGGGGAVFNNKVKVQKYIHIAFPHSTQPFPKKVMKNVVE